MALEPLNSSTLEQLALNGLIISVVYMTSLYQYLTIITCLFSLSLSFSLVLMYCLQFRYHCHG